MRRSLRILQDGKVEARSGTGGTVPDCGRLCNISIGGLAFRCKTAFAEGSPVSLVVTVGENRLSLNATVVSVREVGSEFTIGVEFEGNDSATGETLQHLSGIGVETE